jgi:alpha-L-fucosidase 2
MDHSNVVWDTPSKDSSGSMPLGNGDIGLNVWVEENGDLVFYIGKTDAWNENARLLKLGRVRIKCFTRPVPFSQTLVLGNGTIEILVGKITLKVWVDAHRPVIRVEAEGKEPFDLEVGLEIWRTKDRDLTGLEADSAYGLADGPEPIIETPDTIVPAGNHQILWYHRNPKSAWETSVKHQGLPEWIPIAKDPILHRTFGAAIQGPGLANKNPTTLKSTQTKHKFLVSIYPLTCQGVTAKEWQDKLDRQISDIEKTELEQARRSHEKWWSNFWNRSWIRVTGDKDAEIATRGYILQRFINACGGRGGYPIKFNGSIFTVDAREPEKSFDADYRAWGGPYWFQNTRLPYWPMPASGDFDLMRPLFKMFLDALPFAEFRTPRYFGHPGAFFPETMEFWGTYANSNYGWDREGKPISFCKNTYIRYYWTGGLELVALMLDYYDFTQDRQFAQEILLPLARPIIQFFDRHFPRDEQGKLLFKPAMSLETWQEVVNPLPEIAGLKFVLEKLLLLPEEMAKTSIRTDWQRILSELPELPTHEEDGKTILAPAEKLLGPKMNCENPELYAIFPYRLFGIGKPDLEMARRTFDLRKERHNAGWQQHPIQAALLGLADEAKKLTVERFATKHPGSRFDTFWGPNFDWIPDQDHGCVALMALQTMVMQTEGDKIYLLPAWPEEWNVEFKLHAPKNTTVEGIYERKKWKKLEIQPRKREKDIVGK